jgi:SAM-dependent methyltransferase
VPLDDVAARGFQAAARAYETARPGYPDEAIALLRDHLRIGPGTRVCDLAAGTGKLTRALRELGAAVVAVEPVAAMRGQLSAAVPDVEVLDGTAEELPLPDGSVDVVTVAQAFHWFDHQAALAEIRRVLRSDGALALLWNERDERAPWVAEMSRLIHWHERTVSRYQHTDWAEVVASCGGFTALEERGVDWEQPMTREMLGDRVRSISYIAAMTEARREHLVDEVTGLVTRMEEPFTLPYRCRVQWCNRTG